MHNEKKINKFAIGGQSGQNAAAGAAAQSPAGKKGGLQNMSAGVQQGLSQLGSAFGSMSGGDLPDDVKSTREGIRSAIGSFGPIGSVIAAATGVVDMIGDMTGLSLGTFDQDSADRAGIGGAAKAQNAINSLPGVSMFAGMFAGKTKTGYKSAEIDQMAGGYGGSVADIGASVKLGGTRALFGRKKANKFIEEQNRINTLLTDISLDNKERKSNTYGENIAAQNYNIYNGINNSFAVLAKKGMKFPELEKAKEILKLQLPKFQDGGKLNVIVEGALHARKHDLVEVNPELEGITKKGIPVVTFDDNGEMIQTAEVEAGELILTREITDKLETLYNDGSEEAMIEAGKILSEEIIEYTDDKTGEVIND